MAFGRKKRKDGQQEDEQASAASETDVDTDDAGTEPVTLAGGESTEATASAGGPAGGLEAESFTVNGAGEPPGPEDSAAPSVPPAPAKAPDDPPETRAFDSPPAGSPGPGDPVGDPIDAESLGSAAASPDPVIVPAGETGDDPGLGAYDQPRETSGAATVAESHPEVLVAGAFAAGLVVARVLAALGDDS